MFFYCFDGLVIFIFHSIYFGGIFLFIWLYLIFIDVGQSSLKQTRSLERGCSLSSWNLSNTWIFSCTLSLILSPNSAPGQQQGKQHPSPILDETSVSSMKGQQRPVNTWTETKKNKRGWVSSGKSACLQSGKSRIRFPDPNQYSGS